MTYLIKTISNA